MITIKIQRDDLTATLQNLRRKLKDMSPVMRYISVLMKRAVEDNFAAQGRPRWKPSQRVLKKGGQTLQKSGRLAASIVGSHSRTQARVGTNVVYAAIHQFGGPVTTSAYTRTLAFHKKGGFMSRAAASRKKTGAVRVAFASYAARTFNMPARPFLDMTETDMDGVMAAISKYLDT